MRPVWNARTVVFQDVQPFVVIRVHEPTIEIVAADSLSAGPSETLLDSYFTADDESSSAYVACMDMIQCWAPL